MFSKNNKIKTITYVLMLFFVIVTVLGMIKQVFISSDIDEGYAVAQAYRLVMGDKLILNMWEPHQFSAYLPAVFVKIFLILTGSTEYIVIYLRIIGTLIHVLIACWLFHISKMYMDKTKALFLCLLHMNFLSKWIALPEFELMNYWYLLICFLCYFFYYKIAANKRYLIIAGVCTMLQLCNYPTMIFLYPFYMYGIWKVSRSAGKDIAVSTASSVIPGIGFLCYLFSYMDFETLRKSLEKILSDPSHTERSMLSRFGDFGVEFCRDVLFLSGLFIGIYLMIRIIDRKRRLDKYEQNKVIFTFCTEWIVLCIIQAAGCIFLDQNQFYMQARYLLATVIGIYCFKKYNSQDKEILLFGILPGIVSMIGALFVTNMTMNVAYSKLFICVLCSVFLYFIHEKKEHTANGLYVFSRITMAALLLSLFVCKILLLRVTGCVPVTVNANLLKINHGPLKGIYMVDYYAKSLNENYDLIKEYVTEEDTLFYFGCENITYLYTGAKISAASVQGTSVFNEDFLEYFEWYPDRMPTVVAVDKNFDSDYYMIYSAYNYIVKEWIESEFDYSEVIEGGNMILYIK